MDDTKDHNLSEKKKVAEEHIWCAIYAKFPNMEIDPLLFMGTHRSG